MTAVTVLVPWRPDSPEREAAWTWLRSRWQTAHPGWQILEADCPPGPWSKGAAVQTALPRVEGDLVVVADADCWTDGTADAVHHVATGSTRWAVPHRTVYRLTPDATTAAVAGAPLDHLTDRCTERPYVGHPGGGIAVLTRQLLTEVPPDPRFTGWGHEDDAWALALTTLAGRPWRGAWPLYHLWHPPQARRSRTRGAPGSWQLYQRYRKARGKTAAMRALLAETAAPTGG